MTPSPASSNRPRVVDIAFWGLGIAAVLAGAAVFYVDSMARATYALAISFVAVGVLVMAAEAVIPVSMRLADPRSLSLESRRACATLAR